MGKELCNDVVSYTAACSVYMCNNMLTIMTLKLFTTCAGKLDRLLSLGPLYFAFQALLESWARLSSTRYTYRHT
jgi:hypothetical protein